MLSHIVFPRLASDRFDQLTSNHVQHIVVGESASEACSRLQVAQASHRLRAGNVTAWHEHQIAFAQTQSTAMDEQITNRYLTRHPGVIHLKPRQSVGHPIVPADFACIDQGGECRDGKRLAGRSGRKDRIGIDALWRTQLAHAVTAGQHAYAVFDNCNCHTRDATFGAQTFDARVEPCRRCRREWRRESNESENCDQSIHATSLRGGW